MKPEPDETAFFCPGCHACFASSSETGVCPQCGVWLVEEGYVDPNQPTLISNPLAGDQLPTQVGADSLERLLGTELHVYQIDSLLGRGGMGWVFLALHRDLGRSCALKILSPHVQHQHIDYMRRFEEEGRNAAALVHPNIVTTHAIGKHNSWHFLEMEFVPGRSLQDAIDQQPFTPIRALTIASGIAGGLGMAHRHDIVHRDLKPDNVLLTHQSVPKISDFGLAKRLTPTHSTSQHSLAGTPFYMAPELFCGAEPTPASDIYALGVTLFAMLTGELPFKKSKLRELVSAVNHDPLPDLRRLTPSVTLDVAECVCAMMSRSPANRPQNGMEAQQLLLAVLGHTRDLRALIHESLDGDPTVTWQAEKSRYVIDVKLSAHRRQRVYIDGEEDGAVDRVLSIYSVCGLADPRLFADALRLNSQVCHGALALRVIGGVEHLIMVNNYPRATVDAAEIRHSVHDAARHADAFEQLLHDGDQY